MIKTRREWKEMNLLYREFDSFYHEIALQVGLSDSAFLILYVICELGDGCLQRDICEACFISKQTVHSSIRRLEESGILQLEKSGRDKQIRLTESGRKMVEEKLFPVIAMENEVFGDFPEEESRELLRLTRKYLSLLREEAVKTALLSGASGKGSV